MHIYFFRTAFKILDFERVKLQKQRKHNSNFEQKRVVNWFSFQSVGRE